ncbi:MAG: hypothetical protein ABIJ41_01840 [Candidatus Omnitrophota bacterium]
MSRIIDALKKTSKNRTQEEQITAHPSEADRKNINYFGISVILCLLLIGGLSITIGTITLNEVKVSQQSSLVALKEIDRQKEKIEQVSQALSAQKMNVDSSLKTVLEKLELLTTQMDSAHKNLQSMQAEIVGLENQLTATRSERQRIVDKYHELRLEINTLKSINK